MGPGKLFLLACIGLGPCMALPVHAQGDQGPASAAAESRPAAQAIHSGRLPNGLRYIIVPRRSEAFEDTSRVAIRMRVDGGWRAEGPGENGLVHLIEHLPLEGNSRMSAEEAIAFRDQHTDIREWGAFTSPYASEYFLTTKSNQPPVIVDALRYLGGIAIGLPISAEAVDRQRQIVINEMAGRLDEAMMLHQRARVLAPASEWDISRGYDSSDVATADLGTIEALYRRIYRPDNVTVVVVGDVDPVAMTVLLVTEFGAWSPVAGYDSALGHGTGAAESGALPDGGVEPSPNAGLQHTASLGTAGQRTVLASLRTAAPYPVDTTSTTPRRDAATIDRVIALILSHRLELQALEAGLGSTDFTIAPTDAGGRAFIWQLAPVSAEWRPALAILLDQVAAAPKGGFTERELATAKRIMLRDVNDRNEQAMFYSNGSLSASISDSLNRGLELQSDREASERDLRLLADLTLVSLNETWRRATASAPLQTRIEGFAEEGGVSLSDALAAFADNHAPRAAEALAGGHAGPEREKPLTKPGRIVSDERANDGIRTLVFENGSTLRLIRREHQGKYLEIEVRASAPRARGELTHCDALVLPHFVRAGGTAAQSERSRRDVLWGRDVRFAPFEMTSDGIRTGASARIEDSVVALQDLHAIMSAPGFRGNGEQVAAGLAREALNAVHRDPLTAVMWEVESRLTAENQNPSAGTGELCGSSAGMGRASTYLRPILSQGQVDAAIAGNMDEANVIAQFASTFGQDRRQAAMQDARSTNNQIAPAVLMLDMIPAQGGQMHVGAVWAMQEPDDAHERAAQELLTALFARLLYIELTRNSTVYAPNVARLERVEGQGQPVIAAAATVPAEQAESVLSAVEKVAGDLAMSGPDPQLLETIRALMMKGIAESYNEDRVWAYQAGQLSSRPNAIALWRSATAELQTVTGGEIEELAQEIFAVPFAKTRVDGSAK